jgi:dihydroneopterin aldolase
MTTVSIEKVLFTANHGIFQEEKSVGNSFELSLFASYEEKEPIHSIRDTVDYVVLFELAEGRMSKHHPLLEELASNIVADVKERFPFVKEIGISISKLHPPINRFRGQVNVKIHQLY